MSDSVLPVAFALFAWWFGTGLVFLLERAARARPRRALAGIGAMVALSLLGVSRSSLNGQAPGVYLGFASSILLWGALEMSFLTGLVIGPRSSSCAAGCRGWRHFVHGVRALLYHELALALCAAAVVAVSWNRPNLTAIWTFLVLWGMRVSAKLNLFLGVRNPALELLPQALAHLRCYFGSRPMNALLPVSVSIALLAAALLMGQALAPTTEHERRVEGLMLASLLLLAVLEHLVLILPVRADALWRWATRETAARRSGAAGKRLLPEPVNAASPAGGSVSHCAARTTA